MKIKAITARSKATKELIYAEGISSELNGTDLFLDAKWFTKEDLEEQGQAWDEYKGEYIFNDQVRHLFYYEYDLVTFAIEEVEIV
jgi:hypothetical protein